MNVENMGSSYKNSYKSILRSFYSDITMLDTRNENTSIESIIYPSGWFFNTDRIGEEGTIPVFFHRAQPSVEISTWTFFIQLFTRPNYKLQRAILNRRKNDNKS